MSATDDLVNEILKGISRWNQALDGDSGDAELEAGSELADMSRRAAEMIRGLELKLKSYETAEAVGQSGRHWKPGFQVEATLPKYPPWDDQATIDKLRAFMKHCSGAMGPDLHLFAEEGLMVEVDNALYEIGGFYDGVQLFPCPDAYTDDELRALFVGFNHGHPLKGVVLPLPNEVDFDAP